MATSQGVAEWMASELSRVKFLEQEVAVINIQRKFGKDHVYFNENGNLAIAKPVLAAFRKLTSGTVVWDRSDRLWRLRSRGDAPSRSQE